MRIECLRMGRCLKTKCFKLRYGHCVRCHQRVSFSLVQASAMVQREGGVKMKTRKVVYLAFLIALSIILTRLLSLRIAIGGVEGIRIGFGGLPIIFAGVIFGPLAGGIVGALSDILGFMINPMGAYMPHFTLTSFLTGFIPGLLTMYLFKSNLNFWTLVISISIGQVITSVIMVPIFLQSLFGVPLKVTLWPRVIGQLIHIPLYAYLIRTLVKYHFYRILGNKYEIV